MAEIAPFLLPKSTPVSPQSAESLTPWSDILLEELRAAIELNPPPGIIKRCGFATHSTWKSRTRTSQSKALWLAVLVLIGIWWTMKGSLRIQQTGSEDTGSMASKLITGLEFVDANHPNIRYVGRWVPATDGSHMDGSFPGVYFDFVLNGTSTMLLALYNEIQKTSPPIKRETTAKLPFLPLQDTSHAGPISLLARVDDNEYVVLPNSTSIVSIRENDLDPLKKHNIRIIAPMVGTGNTETLQIQGIWIDKKGQLLPFEPDEDLPVDQQKSPLMMAGPKQRKMLEIVTDMPGSMGGKDRRKNIGSTRGILGGVMGWEYLLGEMFGADHVMVGMEGMCLVQDCKGGRGSPAGLADVFFQSGPVGSEQYNYPWLFQQYIPDVMVMNIGNSDWESFEGYNQEYNKTMWELGVSFEETYIAMIKTIRTLAYPKYTGLAMDSPRYTHGTTRQRAIAEVEVPIFVMRPFRGQLEQATHSVVDRLRMDGDKNLFWLDTSGWLNAEVDLGGQADDQDFFLDGDGDGDDDSPRKQWQLTERGNQRVAILLHMHVCRYLAHDVERCAFLPPEVYQGNEIDPEAGWFEEFVQNEGIGIGTGKVERI